MTTALRKLFSGSVMAKTRGAIFIVIFSSCGLLSVAQYAQAANLTCIQVNSDITCAYDGSPDTDLAVFIDDPNDLFDEAIYPINEPTGIVTTATPQCGVGFIDTYGTTRPIKLIANWTTTADTIAEITFQCEYPFAARSAAAQENIDRGLRAWNYTAALALILATLIAAYDRGYKLLITRDRV